MGACASKPNVLNGDNPEVAPENIVAKDTDLVVKEELVNKEEIVSVNNDNADHTPSLKNLPQNEEGKGSTSEDEKIKSQVEKVADDGLKTDATNFAKDEKKIEEVKLETPVEEVIKPSAESENKTDDVKKLSKEAPAEKTVEEVKPADKPTTAEDKKIEQKPPVSENPNAEAENKKTEEKPVVTKKGKFWWDK